VRKEIYKVTLLTDYFYHNFEAQDIQIQYNSPHSNNTDIERWSTGYKSATLRTFDKRFIELVQLYFSLFNPNDMHQRYPIHYNVSLISGNFRLESVMFNSINNLYEVTTNKPILISQVEFRYMDNPRNSMAA
jgi:hypothetical protein